MKGPKDARDEDGQAGESELDRALRELLVGEAKVRIDPATGQVVPGGEKSSLTDSPDSPTIR